MVSERIQGYNVDGLIGTGGMGMVYLGTHETLGRRAAIKVLLENLSAQPHIRERFIQEARLMAGLNHPNIVTLYDFATEPRFSLIMEYVEGRGLDRMIGQEVGPIPWEKALPLFDQMLEGIGYAHEKGIVHRDIKPSNILISNEGKVKVTDLGIAKIAGQKGMTKTGAQMGTLYYESPEQVKGARDVDHRSDIYSLGMTLYEMLAGRLPFETDSTTSEFAIMSSIVQREAHLDPREYYPHIPEWLVKVVQKSTHLDSEKRFQSCKHFRQVISKYGNLSGSESRYWSEKVADTEREVLSTSPSPSGLNIDSAMPFQRDGSSEEPGMRCPQCGAPVKDEMVFCSECGSSLMQSCPSCSNSVRWNYKHCPRCGVNIAQQHAMHNVDTVQGQFSKNAHGVITDTQTRLLWLVGPDASTSWHEATNWVNDLGDSWRLPSISELQMIYNAGIRYGNWGFFLNGGLFIWSSQGRYSTTAWGFSFTRGEKGWDYRDSGKNRRSFAVRSR